MNKWTDGQASFLIKNYNNYSVEKIADKLGKTKNSIYSKASSLNLSHKEHNKEFMREKSRKYKINHQYFDNVDSEDKAYFLGLMFADGYNYEKRHNISISLDEKDKELLSKFASFTGNERPLFYKIDERSGRSNRSYVLSWTSSRMSEKLSELGCAQNKTFTVSMPKGLSEDLLRHFVRGYYDGDGSLIVSTRIVENGKYIGAVINVSLTSNICFLNEVLEFVPCHMKDKGVHIYEDKRREGIGQLFFSGCKRSIMFLDWIYESSAVYMRRKRDLYDRLKFGIKESKRGIELFNFVKQKGDENESAFAGN